MRLRNNVLNVENHVRPGMRVLRSMLLEKDNFTATLWCCTKCCEDYDLDDDGRKPKRRQDQDQ